MCVFLLGACQHHGVDRDGLPGVVTRYFGDCSLADGGEAVTVKHRGKVLGDVLLDWVYQPPADFRAELSTPVGTPAGRAELSSERVAVSGAFGGEGKFALDEDHMLEVGGYSLGLRIDELGCLINRTWPKRWLEEVEAFEESSKGFVVHGENDHRSWVVEVLDEKSGQRCAFVSVPRYWGLWSFSWQVCFDAHNVATWEFYDKRQVELQPLP